MEATETKDLVEVIDQSEKRAAFDREFNKLYEGKDTPIITTDEQWKALKDGDIAFFIEQEARHDEARARLKAGFGANSKSGQYGYSDLKRLEDSLQQIISDKERFEKQLQEVRGLLNECDRRDRAAKKKMATAEKSDDLSNRDKRVEIQDAKDELEKVDWERSQLLKRKTKNERWLAAVKAQERIFPMDELKKLQRLRKNLLGKD